MNESSTPPLKSVSEVEAELDERIAEYARIREMNPVIQSQPDFKLSDYSVEGVDPLDKDDFEVAIAMANVDEKYGLFGEAVLEGEWSFDDRETVYWLEEHNLAEFGVRAFLRQLASKPKEERTFTPE